jgi:SAM-dependent methyltransferase
MSGTRSWWAGRHRERTVNRDIDRSLMKGHDPGTYAAKVGADYDLLYLGDALETEAAVTALGALARSVGGSGSILEFGIGTGRLGLPLLEQGFKVAGIEASATMIEQMRTKPRGEEIEVVLGDFLSTRVEGHFSVVVLGFNGIFGPADREAQIACFSNAARHLEPGGCFVVEAFVLRPEQLHGDWWITPRSVQHEHIELQVCRYDTATHILERTMVHMRPDGLRFVKLADRYAWPGELDLMARAAGLRLRSRNGGWRGEPFGPSSYTHISVYERV